jgi:SAM-dependent methyltransferase
MKKLNLNIGAGTDIRDGWINHDIVNLDGIDVVHNLNEYPWPWEDNSIDNIEILDVLEHLDNFVLAMEEIHRILMPNGIVLIRVPYWNHSCAYIDPTHKRGFHEQTFDFFDVNSKIYLQRGYYTKAKFSSISSTLILTPGYPYMKIPFVNSVRVRRKIIRRFVGWAGNHVGNIISDVQVEMQKSL